MKHLRLKAAALAAALALLCAGCGAPASSAPSSSGGASSAPASSAPASSAPAQETAALGEYRAMWVSYLEWESFDFSSEAAFAAEMPFVPLLWRNGTVVHTRSIEGLTSSISNVFYSLGQLRFASADS